ncbi:sulfate adenylyltransferase subunit 1 [Roseivirga sp. E12]|uniref:sulfate adenylyltransferase subunit 1 n=1 Tax=Roseivirga sp. E12 TaxID=2819237 RepID=UPI001ABC89F7|nr:GTP-binding protein [Roseivirga sp. E12]MBO3700141.1 GTP-binding protein [Roseivirga sp. E12]
MAISKNKEVLRIATAGSVDDGKSTLIGRLLYETNSITTDKLLAIEESSRRKGLGYTDLSLLTDGLVAEREQGITIDVAHIYFSTPKRKFIIADTPGHVEYTRNMVTGASNADVSIVLVDARNGLAEQTHRHLYISHLLKVPKVIVCVNKMDLVDYDEDRFNEVVQDFKNLLGNDTFKNLSIDFIPVSSLHGENIANDARQMGWYKGDNLLEVLENIEVHPDTKNKPARFPVQLVIRPKSDDFHDYRGYAGKVASGTFSKGDTIRALPSGMTARIQSIDQFEDSLEHAEATESVTIRLDHDIDISRGDMLVKDEELRGSKDLVSNICWMDNAPLVNGKTYKLQHGVNETRVKVAGINFRVETSNLIKDETATELGLNDVGQVTLKSSKAVLIDRYEENRANGAFILIDEFTNSTVGVGFAS